MQVYRARNPRQSPLWQCVDRHFERFVEIYPDQYLPRYGPLRPIIPEVVHKFLECGNLERGFARIRYDHCIFRKPFSVEKMTLESPGGLVIYRSRRNAKINRNFELFTPADFLAAITQYIPDKGAQMVRHAVVHRR